MKTILIAITIILSFSSSQAQTNYNPTGTWKWTNGNDTIEFYFKTDSLYYIDEYIPIIIAFHKYTKNGQVIENCLANINSNYSQRLFSLSIINTADTNPKLGGDFKDISRNTLRYMILKRINPTSMEIGLMYLEGVRNGKPYGFTLPRNFTLIKQ